MEISPIRHKFMPSKDSVLEFKIQFRFKHPNFEYKISSLIGFTRVEHNIYIFLYLHTKREIRI